MRARSSSYRLRPVSRALQEGPQLLRLAKERRVGSLEPLDVRDASLGSHCLLDARKGDVRKGMRAPADPLKRSEYTLRAIKQ